MLRRAGQSAHRYRLVVLAVWFFVTVAGGILGGSVFDRAQGPGPLAGAESTVVEQRRLAVDPAGEEFYVVLSGLDALGSQAVATMPEVIRNLRSTPGVADVRDPWTRGAYDLLSDNRASAVVRIRLDPELTDDEALEAARQSVGVLRLSVYPDVIAGGDLLAEDAFAKQAVSDSARGEGFALVLLLVLLVAALGGAVVGALPVATSIASVTASLLGLWGLAALVPVSEFAVNVVTVLGLGLCVDYSLLVVSRFREERQKAGTRTGPINLGDIMGDTVASAGKTVAVSGLVVGSALTALLILGDPVLTGMASGGLVAVTVATLAALTLTPALLSVGHSWVPPTDRGLFRRTAREPHRAWLMRSTLLAQRRPWTMLGLSATLLLVAAIPLLSLEVGESDASSLRPDSEPRLAQEAIERNHDKLSVAPLTVIAETPADDPRLNDLPEQLANLPGVADREDVVPLDVLPDGGSRLLVTPEGTTTGKEAQRLVEAVRGLDPGFELRVGGPAAEFVDNRDRLVTRLPLALAAVLLVTGLLMLVLTRAPVVAAKTLLLATLSLTATMGVVVAVFQWGWGLHLLGVTNPGTLDVTTPLLLFMFAFGLSMDYHVFLVSRIKEAWDASSGARAGSDARERNDRAVREGVAATGPVVTLAATAIVVVFLGFALGDLVEMKEVGIGMTVAILIDVTIVRGVLLPAAMTLLGSRNWWRSGG